MPKLWTRALTKLGKLTNYSSQINSALTPLVTPNTYRMTPNNNDDIEMSDETSSNVMAKANPNLETARKVMEATALVLQEHSFWDANVDIKFIHNCHYVVAKYDNNSNPKDIKKILTSLDFCPWSEIEKKISKRQAFITGLPPKTEAKDLFAIISRIIPEIKDVKVNQTTNASMNSRPSGYVICKTEEGATKLLQNVKRLAHKGFIIFFHAKHPDQTNTWSRRVAKNELECDVLYSLCPADKSKLIKLQVDIVRKIAYATFLDEHKVMTPNWTKHKSTNCLECGADLHHHKTTCNQHLENAIMKLPTPKHPKDTQQKTSTFTKPTTTATKSNPLTTKKSPPKKLKRKHD